MKFFEDRAHGLRDFFGLERLGFHEHMDEMAGGRRGLLLFAEEGDLKGDARVTDSLNPKPGVHRFRKAERMVKPFDKPKGVKDAIFRVLKGLLPRYITLVDKTVQN